MSRFGNKHGLHDLTQVKHRQVVSQLFSQVEIMGYQKNGCTLF